MSRIKSVIELSRYKVGERAFIVNMRAVGQDHIVIEPADSWVCEHHPKVLFERKLNVSWRYRDRLPKLPADMFQSWTTLLTAEFVVEEFVVKEINRSSDTGEFYYARDEDDLVMPESYLMDSREAAHRERKRIIALIKKWARP